MSIDNNNILENTDLNSVSKTGVYKITNEKTTLPMSEFYSTLGDIIKYKENGDFTMLKVNPATGEATLSSYSDIVNQIQGQ